MHQGATWDDRGDNKNVTPREEMNTSQTWQVVSQQSNATKCGQITDDLSLLLKKDAPSRSKHFENRRKAKKKRLHSPLLHISTVTHLVDSISPLTRVA